jgi:hypothetical protein
MKDQTLNSEYSGVGITINGGCADIEAISQVHNSSSYKFTLTPTSETTIGNEKQLTLTNSRDINSFIYPSILSLANLKFIGSFMQQYGAIMNFDASVSSSYTSVGSKVSVWKDTIGTSQFIQTTDSSRPVLTTQNGKTAFTFNNNLLNSPAVNITYRSVIYVYKNISTQSYSQVLHSVSGEYISHGGLNNTLIHGNGNAGGPANTWVNHTQVGNPSTPLDSIPRSYVNNLAVQTQVYTIQKTSNITTIGRNMDYSTGWINGVICEIVIFPTALTDTERTTIVDHLITKWGVVV